MPGEPLAVSLDENRFVTANDPVNAIDPDGRQAQFCPSGCSRPTVTAADKQAAVAGLGAPATPAAAAAVGNLLIVAEVAVLAADIATFPSGEGLVARQALKEVRQQLVNPKRLTGTQARREMTGSNTKRLTKSMKENGFDANNPIEVVQDGSQMLINDGNHRTQAAIRAGIDEVPVKKVDVPDQRLQELRQGADEVAFERGGQ